MKVNDTVQFRGFWAVSVITLVVKNPLFYNVLLIPVAAGALYPLSFAPMMFRELHPMLAAFAMAFSSVSVVLNSLRLQWRKNVRFD